VDPTESMISHQFYFLRLPREHSLPVVLHADDNPALLLSLGHERVGERAYLRLGSISIFAYRIVVMYQHH
jgi:hypothetical protein